MAGNCCIVVCSMDSDGNQKNKCKRREHGSREFTGETAVETEEETTEKTVTAGIGYRAASADSEGITEQLVSDMSFEQVQTLMDEMLGEDSFSIGTALKNMINGETVFSKEAVQQFLRSLFLNGWKKNGLIFFAFFSWCWQLLFFQILQRYLKQPDWRGKFLHGISFIIYHSDEQLSAAWSFSWKTAGMDDSVYERPGTCLFRGSFSSIRSCHGFCILSGGSSSGVAGGMASSHFDSARG